MQALNLPIAQLSLTKSGQQIFVNCLVRKKPVLLTPEEWVRQHLIFFLINHRNVPPGLVAVEKSIKVNGLTRRFDILVSDSTGKSRLLVECKAPNVPINAEVFYQVAQYNAHIRASYFLMSNGLLHYFGDLAAEKPVIDQLTQLPLFENW